eukprot:10278912-Ditylum_brightwellii.AAC.1
MVAAFNGWSGGDWFLAMQSKSIPVGALVQELKGSFDIIDEEKTVEEYLGNNKAIHAMEITTEHKTLASASSVVAKDKDGKTRQKEWNYRSVIGMLNFLVNSTYTELAHVVHQCARLCEDPKASHETAVNISLDIY